MPKDQKVMAPFEQSAPLECIAIERANGQGVVIPCTPEEVARVHRVWLEGAILFDVRSKDGRWSCHNSRYIIGLNAMTKAEQDAWITQMKTQAMRAGAPVGGPLVQSG